MRTLRLVMINPTCNLSSNQITLWNVKLSIELFKAQNGAHLPNVCAKFRMAFQSRMASKGVQIKVSTCWTIALRTLGVQLNK